MKHNIKLFLLLLTIVVTYDASAVKKIEVGTPSSFRSGGSDRPQASLNFDLSTLSFSSGVTQNLPSATGGSGVGSINYTSSTPSICSISGSTVTALQSGRCEISATRAASGVYASVTVTRDTVIPSLTQAQVGASTNTATINVGGTAQITGSGGSGNGVFNFQSSTPGICSISGNTITGVTNGTCSFSATKASDGLFAASNPSSSVTISILQAQTLTMTAASNSIYTSGTTTLTTTGNQGTVTYAASGSCTVSGSTVTAGSTAGTCTITASAPATLGYSAGSATKTITVNGLPSACWVQQAWTTSSCGSGNRIATLDEIRSPACSTKTFYWTGSYSIYLGGQNGRCIQHNVGSSLTLTVQNICNAGNDGYGMGNVSSWTGGSTQAVVCVTP